jgi:CRP-like cAMP-binding protein
MKTYDDPLKEFMMSTLRNVYYLKNVSKNSIEEVTFYLIQEYHDEGKVLFRGGDPVDEIIFVASGSVSITVELLERDVVIETLHQGSAMGFNGILKDSLHLVTAKCDSKVSIYVLKKSKIKELFNF